ncbi:Transcriptional regulatory protein moc3 [Fusarium oxysporum f. sp. albedinis]|nr:Transcriptional regulatory protein moc3 [Fusarium oxysporum f. sp. albedinis]
MTLYKLQFPRFRKADMPGEGSLASSASSWVSHCGHSTPINEPSTLLRCAVYPERPHCDMTRGLISGGLLST